jgi:hypothetical protein
MENGWMDGAWVVVVFVDGWLHGMMSCRLGDQQATGQSVSQVSLLQKSH